MEAAVTDVMTESPEQLHRAFEEAFNRHDVDAIVALYEPDAVLVGVNGPVRGMDAIRDEYRAVLSDHSSIVLETLGTNFTRDLATLHGKWVLHQTGPDGVQVTTEGRTTETARQQPDGRWLFVIDNPSIPKSIANQ